MLHNLLPTNNPVMRENAITSFSCLLVQKVSHHGTLFLFQKRLKFVYANGVDDENSNLQYTDITSVEVESRLAHAMNNLTISTSDQSFLFSGLHEAQIVKDLITLLQEEIKQPKSSIGFTSVKDNNPTIKWADLENPTLLYSTTLPAPMSTLYPFIEKKDSFLELYSSAGNEEIKIGEWEQKEGYVERTVDYLKLVVLPVLGKNLIKVSETQRMFHLDGKIAIGIISDLGKTPYADCFDPQVQMFFVDNGDKVEYLVMFEMIWSSEPFVKSIIQSKTTDEIRLFYSSYGKQLIRELGGGEESEDATKGEEEANNEDDFGKTRKIYKISIICLLVMLVLSITIKYWPRGHFHIGYHGLGKFLALIVFFMLLIFF